MTLWPAPQPPSYLCAFPRSPQAESGPSVLGSYVVLMMEEPLAERLANRLSHEESRGRFSGVAGIVWSARTHAPKVLTHACGRADEAAGLDTTPQTRFPIASLSKLFTATAALRLWQRGELPLDAPITSYLGGGGPTWAAQVTVHHLLSHTAGLPSLFANQPELQRFVESLGETVSASVGGSMGSAALESAPVSREALWRAILRLPLRAAPGSRFEYSNTGYILTALIIERLFHKPFSQIVKEQVLTPLGLQDTAPLFHEIGVHESPAVSASGPPALRRAVGHFATAAAPRIHPAWLLGAGDLESTVSDLLAFCRGLDDDSLLGAAARQRLLFQPLPLLSAADCARSEEGPPIRGYGWRLWLPGDGGRSAAEPAPSATAWHDGALPGLLCTLHRPLNGDAAVVLLVNRLPGVPHKRAATLSLRRLARELLQMVAHDRREAEPLAALGSAKPTAQPCVSAGDPSDTMDRQAAVTLAGRPLLDALCGTYALDATQRLLIRAEAGGGFHIRGEGTPPFSLLGITQNVDAAAAALRSRACALLSTLAQGPASTQRAPLAAQADRRDAASLAQLRALCAERLPDPDALCALWQLLTGPAGLGPLESFHVLQHEGCHFVAIRCHFAAQPLDLHVHFDDDGKIVGFYLHPVGTAPAVCELPLQSQGPGCCLADGYFAATQDLFITALRPPDRPEHDAQVLLLRGDAENSVLRRAIRVRY